MVNHQWSKSLDFEDLFRDVLRESLGDAVDYFSLLRPLTSLRIAELFAKHPRVLPTSSAAATVPSTSTRRARRPRGAANATSAASSTWSSRRSSPAHELDAIFGGNEPLRSPALRPQFDTLLGLSPDVKPWECVGDVGECRASAFLGAQREDRAGDWMLQELSVAALRSHPSLPDDIPAMLRPIGPHRVPLHHAAPLGLD